MQRPEYHIIVKIFQGQASRTERDLAASWLKDSRLNRLEYQKLWEIWNEYGKHHESYQVDLKHDFEELISSTDTNRFEFKTIYRIVATVTLLFIIGLATIRIASNSARKQQIFTSEVDGKEVKLDDGSLVILRTGSKLILGENFNQNNRQVELQGEAYFDVSHNIQKPFLVQTGSLSIKVLGTSFLVTPLSRQTEVALYSGKVEVYSDKQRINLLPNQTAIFNKTLLLKESVSDNSMSWRTKKLVFKDKTLEEVFRDLERHYQVKIKVEEGIATKLLTTSFYDQSIEEVMTVISNIHNLEARKRTQNHYYIQQK